MRSARCRRSLPVIVLPMDLPVAAGAADPTPALIRCSLHMWWGRTGSAGSAGPDLFRYQTGLPIADWNLSGAAVPRLPGRLEPLRALLHFPRGPAELPGSPMHSAAVVAAERR